MAESVALLAAVGCALLWAAFDAARKQLVTVVAPIPLTCALAIGQAPVYLAWAAWEGFIPPNPGYATPGIAVWLLNMAANILFFESLKRAQLSATIPLLSLVPVFAAAIAFITLNEALEYLEIAGVFLVVCGALAVATGDRGGGVEDRSRQRQARIGAAMMATVAALWAATAVCDKVSMQHGSIAMHAAVQVVGLAISLLAWLGLRGELRGLLAALRVKALFVGGCLIAAAALALQLYAVLGAPVGIVEAIKRAIGATAALILGRMLFGEAITNRRVAAVMAMAVGVWLVAA